MTRKDVYGKKKEFILNHYDDICMMRERMSARRVAAVYGGLITKDDIYKLETVLNDKPKKRLIKKISKKKPKRK